MKAASVLMILLFSFAVCKSQTATINLPNDSVSFSIQTKDRLNRETGFFRYNHLTNRLTTRGNQNGVFKVFSTYLLPMVAVFNAQQEVFKYFDENGCVTDQDKFNEAMRNYLLIKRKYGM